LAASRAKAGNLAGIERFFGVIEALVSSEQGHLIPAP